jgi:hypothetical protein
VASGELPRGGRVGAGAGEKIGLTAGVPIARAAGPSIVPADRSVAGATSASDGAAARGLVGPPDPTSPLGLDGPLLPPLVVPPPAVDACWVWLTCQHQIRQPIWTCQMRLVWPLGVAPSLTWVARWVWRVATHRSRHPICSCQICCTAAAGAGAGAGPAAAC